MNNINISVIIPSYNSEKTIGYCLDSLDKQENKLNREVIVVDCSPNNKVDIIVRKHKGVVFLKQKKRFTPGEGRNIGANEAKGEALVFLDSDVILRPDTLEKIWKYYNEGYKVFNCALEVSKLFGFSWIALTKHYYFHNEHRKREEIELRRNLTSTLLVCDRELFFSENGFLNIPQGEDTEFSEKLAKKGIKLFFISDIFVHLIHSDGFVDIVKKVFNTGFYRYYNRHKDSVLSKKLALMLLLPFIVFAKMLRIGFRNFVYSTLQEKALVLLTSPVVFLYGIFWMFGMYKSFFFDLTGKNYIILNRQ